MDSGQGSAEQRVENPGGILYLEPGFVEAGAEISERCGGVGGDCRRLRRIFPSPSMASDEADGHARSCRFGHWQRRD
jgi:hypothetical protein